MPYTPSNRVRTEVQEVRDLTTSDTTALPDAKIDQFLFSYLTKSRKARVKLAAADAIDYLLRDVEWDENTLLDASFSKNLRVEVAARYRRDAGIASLRLN